MTVGVSLLDYPTLELVTEPRAVATGCYVQLVLTNRNSEPLCLNSLVEYGIRSLPLAVLYRVLTLHNHAN